jgi:hypothetical protein
MQTFLPYSDYVQSARVLDRQRLGKQRVETLQLLKANLVPSASRGWVNHPAAKMWRGYELNLISYGVAMCDEWLRRGYRDTCRDKILSYADLAAYRGVPPWLGDAALHASHRANLLRKDPDFYGQYGWSENPDDPYVWPVN